MFDTIFGRLANLFYFESFVYIPICNQNGTLCTKYQGKTIQLEGLSNYPWESIRQDYLLSTRFNLRSVTRLFRKKKAPQEFIKQLAVKDAEIQRLNEEKHQLLNTVEKLEQRNSNEPKDLANRLELIHSYSQDLGTSQDKDSIIQSLQEQLAFSTQRNAELSSQLELIHNESASLRKDLSNIRSPNKQNLLGKFPLSTELVTRFTAVCNDVTSFTLFKPVFEVLSDQQLAIFSFGLFGLCNDAATALYEKEKKRIETPFLYSYSQELQNFFNEYLKNNYTSILESSKIEEDILRKFLEKESLRNYFTQRGQALPENFFAKLLDAELPTLRQICFELCSLCFSFLLSAPALRLRTETTEFEEENNYKHEEHAWTFTTVGGTKFQYIALPMLVSDTQGGYVVECKARVC